MKLIKKIIFILILLFFASHIKVYGANTPYFYIDDVTKDDNSETVDIKFYAENMKESSLSKIGFVINYDSSKLEYVSSRLGDGISSDIKMADNRELDGKIRFGIVSMTNINTNGLYYIVRFKVKDTKSDIPLDLSLKESKNISDKNVAVSYSGGSIKMKSKDGKTNDNQKIDDFHYTNDDDKEISIEDIIKENGKVDFSDDDELTYEIEDSDVISIMHNGTIIANKDGKTNVRVKLNGKTIGNVEVTVEQGKIREINGSEEEVKFEETSVSSNDPNRIAADEIKENSEPPSNKTENASNTRAKRETDEGKEELEITDNHMAIIFIILILTILFFVFYRKYKNQKKKYKGRREK